jgi:SSS family solute:Na+ symporter
MYAGFAVILVAAIWKFGGVDFLLAKLPAQHLTWHGGNSPQFVFVWYFIAMSTLVDPSFYQRCYAAKSAATARNGILTSVVFWFLFDFMTTTTGLYARAALPALENAAESYPRLAVALLPPPARGIFFVALLAIIMSTIDGYAFLSAVTFGKDIWWKLLGEKKPEPVHFIRLSLIFTFLLAVGLAVWSQSVVNLWYQVGTLATPALLIPLASSFSTRWKMSSAGALLSMLSSATATTAVMILNSTKLLHQEIEPIYPGLLVSLVVFTSDRLLRRGRHMP